MSFNQSRTEKSEKPQYRKSGRFGSTGLQRNYSGGKGGGGIAPPPSSSNNSSLSSDRSPKKSNNAQGGQSRVRSGSASSDSNNAADSSRRGVQNGAHAQPPPPLHGASDAPATGVTVKSTDISTQKSIRGFPKAPSSNAPTITSNTLAPSTPAKDSSGAGGFSLQFRSISPGFMNGMLIPARTSSVPPNLDEQKGDQACHDSLRAEPTLPTPSIPKQQLLTKNAGAIDQSNIVEVHPMSKAKREMQVSAGPPTTQTQKASVHPISWIPMQVPYHQPQVQVQFGGPNPQLQSQGMANTSLLMPMRIPLPMGNPSQAQQQIFVPGLQPHIVQSQGMMHQGPSMNFSSQMGTQLHPQVGNMGINVAPQFQQQQVGKFGGPRKAVRITHPDTREELRLDKRADTYADGGSSGLRSHPNVPPQSQPIPSFPRHHAINCYPNSDNPSSLFYPGASSVPLTSTQITSSSQAPRFYNQDKPLLEPNRAKNTLSRGKKKRKEALQKADRAGTTTDLYMAHKGPEEIKETDPPSESRESTSTIISKHLSADTSHVINCYPNSDHPSSLFYPGASSVPLTSTQITSSSQAPRFYNQDKPLLEPNRAKNTLARGRKKLKEALQKADRAGTTSDLYMAYKGPEEIKETDPPSESRESTSTIISKHLSADTSQEDVPNGIKAVPNDWEDAADISIPKSEISDDGRQVGGAMKFQRAKKYSRDFLLKFSEQRADLPEGFEIPSAFAEGLIVYNGNVPHESYPSPGRNIDRSMGGRLDRRGSGLGDDDKWSKVPGPLSPVWDLQLDVGFGGNVGFQPGQGGNYGVLRNSCVPSPIQYAGGILSGPICMGPQGGVLKNSSDSDRWQRATGFQKGLIPSPQTPLQAMHKAERKYEVGEINDEEQAKQRQLKGILNKLTPQNFEKLFEQVKQVNIDNARTLTGVISQIFDKALTEPTFCEMYANFCFQLAGDFPDFSEDNEKITFKRILLNKCQEEFERGEREQEEANRAEEDGEAKQSEEREEKRVQARRRMLGNIRLIGELYKKKMLTERIMHECIKKLLGQYQNPDEEDVEASPIQYAGGILSGSICMGPQGGLQRNSSDSDRWQRATGFQKGLIPCPQTPLQAMHKAEGKYEVGKINDEEQAELRQFRLTLFLDGTRSKNVRKRRGKK